MQLGVVLILLLVSILIFLSLYLINEYNEIILLQNQTKKKFEPIDIAINKYIDITNKLINIVEETNLKEELNILSLKLSRVRSNNKKILVLKDADYTLNRVFDLYKNNTKKLKKEYIEYNDKILYAKDIYNKKVMEYNDLLYKFPNNIITKVFKIGELKTIDGE